MADIKWSAFPSIGELATGDVLVGLRAGANVRFSALTIPWSLANGGTNASLTASNGGIFYSTATSGAILSGTATAGKMLQSGATAAPTWSTPTYPGASGTAGTILRSDGTNNVYSTSTFADTYAVSTLLYASSANTVSGLATTNRAVLGTDATGVPNWLALTDGQLIIGSTAGAPAAATLTAGAGISISNGSNSITISSSSGVTSWQEIAGTTQAAAVNTGYIIGNASQTTVTLPATAAVGSVVAIAGLGAAGFILAPNAGQTIKLQAGSTSVSVTSAEQYDSITVVCVTANTTWVTISAVSTGFVLA